MVNVFEVISSARKGVKMAGLAVAVGGMILTGQVSEAQACQKGNQAVVAGTAFIKAASSRSAASFSSALKRHTHLESIALFALGKYRKELPAAKKSQFVSLTGDYIAKTLAEFSLKFRANQIKFVNCRGSVVETKLLQLGGRPAQKVLWRFRGNRVADVNVQNVWLAQLLRSNFASIISRGGGFDALWKKLSSG